MVESAPPKLKPSTYARHKPEETLLYQIVQGNWLSFQTQVLRDTGYPLPSFVIKEFEEYLRCGILAHGFLRLKCEDCDHEHLVAFSCKRRGFCPSCGGRRMAETAAHLVDSVLPMKPTRQWVLSFPIPIRLCLSARPELMTRLLNITQSTISCYYRAQASLSKSKAMTGSVTLIQRFGGSLAVNPHFHSLFIDGTYELNDQKEPSDFHSCPTPKVRDLEPVLAKIIKRIIKHLQKAKIIVKDENSHFQYQMPDQESFSILQASSITYRFATGPSKGKKALVLKALPDGDHNSTSGLVAKNSGFSLHAGVATKAQEREKLEKICRYIARPALSEERLSTNVRGEIIYRLKKPWSDGTLAVKFTPMEFMERLAALVPRPKIHLTRYHGVLAPHYKFRKQIVKQVVSISSKAKIDSLKSPASNDKKSHAKKSNRIPWAKLLKRVFDIDITICPKCRGKVRIISAIEDPAVISKILNHLGLPSTPPRLQPARGPPDCEQSDLFSQDFPDY